MTLSSPGTAGSDAPSGSTGAQVPADDLALPTQAKKRFEGLLVVTYFLAFLFAFGSVLAVAIAVLPAKAGMLDPQNATGIVSLVSAVGTLVALVTNPVAGRLSDRTTSRIGMRRPWLIAGAIITPIGFGIMSAASSVGVLVLGFAVVELGVNVIIAALVASVADQFAIDRRGLVSGFIGAAQTFGIVIITGLIASFGQNMVLQFVVPGLLVGVFAVVFAIALPDRRLPADQKPAFAAREVPGTFWVSPRKNPDYGFAWFSRFAIFIGIAAVNTYQFFYLVQGLHVPVAQAIGSIALAQLVLALASTVGAIVSGRVSDRIGRRKPFVIAAAVIFAIGLVIVAVGGTFTAFLIGIAVLGFGQGVYLAVDLALVTQVLRDPRTIGKDLGVLNIANVLPGSLVPAVAPLILAIGATGPGALNFTALFVTAALAAIIGAILIVPVRRVR